MKCSGKSTLARELSDVLDIPCMETDDLVKQIYAEETGEQLTCRQLFRRHGEETFREYEARAVELAGELHWCILSLGGSTFLNAAHRRTLYPDSLLVWLNPPVDTLWERIEQAGMPPFLERDDAREWFERRCEQAAEVIGPLAHVSCDTSECSPEEAAEQVADRLSEEMHTRMHSPNTLGSVVRVTTFGESHGPAMGVVLDGLKPGIEINREEIQRQLTRRRPGQSSVTTSRDEKDQVKILSGVFQGKTTGMPVAMMVENRDADSSKYEALKDLFRPGHADFTFWKKYGIRDYRGGGRSSGRETVSRVAAGAVALSMLREEGVEVRAWADEIAGIEAEEVDYGQIEQNPVRCPDPEAAQKMEQAISDASEEGDSVGGVVRLKVSGLPAGLGDPVFGKLDARLSGGLMSLGAVKGIEFGAGFEASRMRGSENNDEMRVDGFVTNHAGGVLGGISTGQDLDVRLAVKPTPSVSREQQTVDIQGRERDLVIEGRHDPCIVPRVVPAVEAMAALILLDCREIQDRLRDVETSR
ncbi:MAG: chorismate synthase [Planctomycetota bacterium]